MELKEYLKPCKKIYKYSLLLSFVSSLIILVYLVAKGPRYKATGLLFVESYAPAETERKYTYGGFYSQQKSASFTQNLPGILLSEGILISSYRKLGRDFDSKDIRKGVKNLRARVEGPQVLRFTVYSDSEEGALSIWNAVFNASFEAVDALSRNSNQEYILQKINKDPFVFAVSRKPVLVSGAFFLLTNLVLYAATLTAQYLKE